MRAVDHVDKAMKLLARDASPFSMRTEKTLVAQINTHLRLMGKSEIREGQYSLKELEDMLRKVSKV